MTNESELSNVLQKLRRYCSRAEKCSDDILKYLDNYDFSSADTLIILETLKKEKFVDDERYTKAFVNDKLKFNKWGKIKIHYSLRAKKIEESMIYSCLDLIDSEEYFATLESLLKLKIKELIKKNTIQIKQSLIKFAYSRGFEYEISERVIKTILK